MDPKAAGAQGPRGLRNTTSPLRRREDAHERAGLTVCHPEEAENGVCLQREMKAQGRSRSSAPVRNSRVSPHGPFVARRPGDP